MSAEIEAAGVPDTHELVTCASCEFDFDPGRDTAEAQHFAATHNDLWHAGAPIAYVVELDDADDAPLVDDADEAVEL